jgi:hypothetical protein
MTLQRSASRNMIQNNRAIPFTASCADESSLGAPHGVDDVPSLGRAQPVSALRA